MSILSITFHTVENKIQEWDIYLENDLHQLVENLLDVEQYVLSEVQSELIDEGKNTNLFLVFDNDERRDRFMQTEMPNLQERILAKFGEQVIIFPTFLDPKRKRL